MKTSYKSSFRETFKIEEGFDYELSTTCWCLTTSTTVSTATVIKSISTYYDLQNQLQLLGSMMEIKKGC